jgi:hypothetical protein
MCLTFSLRITICFHKIEALSSYVVLNWDFIATSGFGYFEVINAMLTLQNQSITSMVASYGDSGILTEEEHNAMHSTLLSSSVSFPHSFLYTPVYKIPGDYKSKIVAFIGSGFAWDFALRFLLPDNIEGIVVEIRNSCNQTGAYELIGIDAFYLGDNITHESTYDDMEVVRELSVSTHPNFTTTAGNCHYTIVRKILSLSFQLMQKVLTISLPFCICMKAYIPKHEISQQIPHEYTQNLCWSCRAHLCARRHRICCLRHSSPSS